MSPSLSYCLVVPHYNHEQSFASFLPQLIELGIPCIIVDDGSSMQSKEVIRGLLSNTQKNCLVDVHLIEHPINRGKGAAMITGGHYARSLGHTHMVQIDADGQHNPADIKEFIDYSQKNSSTIVSGAPTFAANAPKARVYGRKVTDFWVMLETLSLQIKDSLCGFRIYPLTEFEQVLDRYYIGSRMEFDTEILVKSMWQRIDLHFIPTKVIYLEKNISHFHYLRDNIRLIKLHTRLMFGMLFRLPTLLFQRFKHAFKS